MNKPAYYGILPAEVRYNENLIPNAKILYSEITALCNKEGYCWASNDYFADLYKVSKNAVSTWINSLMNEGFIKIELKKIHTGTKRKVYLAPAQQKLVSPAQQKLGYNNKDSNILSKDSKDFASPKVFKNPFIKKCIEDWNKLEYTQNIQITKKTKLIQKLEKYINQLLKGTFTNNKGNKTFDIDWFKQNNISLPFNAINKSQILQTIMRVSLYNKEGYFRDQQNYPKDLATLMYNPRTGKSWFLLAYYKKPKPFNTIQNPNEKVSHLIINYFDGKKIKIIKSSCIQSLYRGIKSINEFVENIPKESLKVSKIKREVGKPIKIIKEYIHWLEHQLWIKEINVNMFNAKSKVWKMFISSKEEEYQGYKLWDKIW